MIAVDVEAHGIVEVVLRIIPCQGNLTHARLCSKTCGHATGSIDEHVETLVLEGAGEELVVLCTTDIDAVHTVTTRLTSNGLIGSIDSTFRIP